jgi:hypothetical protein
MAINASSALTPANNPRIRVRVRVMAIHGGKRGIGFPPDTDCLARAGCRASIYALHRWLWAISATEHADIAGANATDADVVGALAVDTRISPATAACHADTSGVVLPVYATGPRGSRDAEDTVSAGAKAVDADAVGALAMDTPAALAVAEHTSTARAPAVDASSGAKAADADVVRALAVDAEAALAVAVHAGTTCAPTVDAGAAGTGALYTRSAVPLSHHAWPADADF